MGYLEISTGKWICEDECLEKSNNKNMLCGETDHLTSFALLLTGNNSNSKCSDGNEDYIYAWLSLAFVSLAIIIVLVAVMSKEVQLYKRKQKINKFLKSQQGNMEQYL